MSLDEILQRLDELTKKAELIAARLTLRGMASQVDWSAPLPPEIDRLRTELGKSLEAVHMAIDKRMLQVISDPSERARFARDRRIRTDASGRRILEYCTLKELARPQRSSQQTLPEPKRIGSAFDGNEFAQWFRDRRRTPPNYIAKVVFN